MSSGVGGAGGGVVPPPAYGMLDRFCAAVDRINAVVGRAWALTILAVTFVVMYEVIARSAFNAPTIWANEITIYLSAMAYLIAGGYALLYRRHVRIDLVYTNLGPRGRMVCDIAAFVFFVAYAGTLIWVGGESAWTSFLQRETTSTPWDPPIWPVKFAIPIAGVLLLLQGIVNLLRETGAVRPAEH